MPLVNKCFYDGDFTVAKPIETMRTENPIDFQPACRLYMQRFRQFGKYYAPLPINSPLSFADPTEAPPLNLTVVLQFKGSRTGNMIVNSSAGIALATLQAAFDALPTAGPGRTTVVGAWPNYAVEFHPLPGDDIEAGRNLITGSCFGTPAYQVKVNLVAKGPATQTIQFVPVDTSGSASGAVFVGDGPRQNLRGGVQTWERRWCNIPASYTEYQGYNYQMQRMQLYRVLWNSYTDTYGQRHDQYVNFIRLSEYNEPLSARVSYSYCLGSQLGNKNNPLWIPYRIIHYTDSFGVEYVYAVGAWGVAEGTTATHWMGDIWKVKNVFVNPY